MSNKKEKITLTLVMEGDYRLYQLYASNKADIKLQEINLDDELPDTERQEARVLLGEVRAFHHRLI